MTVQSRPTPHTEHASAPASHRSRFTNSAWALGIVGAITAFEGAFILLAGDDQWIGIGGALSWRVGDLDPMWGYGLLSAGILALLAALALVLKARTLPPPQTGPQRGRWGALTTHAIVFLAVNAFLWLQDIALGGGLSYAYWVTIPWGIGLIAHAIAEYTATRRNA